MNLTRINNRLARPALYLCVGVLPALFLALLSLAFLVSGTFLGILLSLAAWMGCLGLMLATLQPPWASTSGRLRLTSLLLVLGILAISPLLVPVTENPLEAPTLSALIAGPPLAALHYLYCALPLFGRRQWRNAGLAVTFVGLCFVPYWLRAKPPTHVIYATASTHEVSLIVDGAKQAAWPRHGPALPA